MRNKKSELRVTTLRKALKRILGIIRRYDPSSVTAADKEIVLAANRALRSRG